ncbi:MAG: hypothetical protein RL732_1304 [Bacteroidota bacterium]
MKFQVGDKVVVKHTNEEAEVVDIINKQMVLLEINGTQFPAYADGLEFPYFKQFSEKKTAAIPREKKFIDSIPVERKVKQEKVADGIWLTIIPIVHNDEFGDEVIDSLKFHLVNRTHDELHFQYEIDYTRGEGFSLQNQLHPFEDFYLHDIPFEQVNDNPVLGFEFSLRKEDKTKASYFEHFIKLKPKQVYKQVRELRDRGEATYSLLIAPRYPDKPKAEPITVPLPVRPTGASSNTLSDIRSRFDPPLTVLDLHIEVLEPNHEKLSGPEKLQLQLDTLEKYLGLAIIHHLQSMIVIHGVGSGKLKDEIHALLSAHRDISGFVNRYHPAYGFGATEISFH